MGELLHCGAELKLSSVTSDDQLSQWHVQVNDWVGETANYLGRNFGAAKEHLFMHPGAVMKATVDGTYNNAHNNACLHLEAKLNILRNLIETAKLR